MDSKEQCIADFLEIDIDDLEKEECDHWGLEVYNGYAIGTDSEADEATKEYIKATLWAFNSSFLAEMTDIPISVFEALQPQCEDANDAVLALIKKTCGIESFIEAAIDADGRGRFLAIYDGEEHCEYYMDEQWGEQVLYFYRID